MRRRTRTRTRFSAWVERETVRGVVASLSRLTPVTKNAVYGWLDGRREPRLSTAGFIVQISGGDVSLEDIVAHRSQVREKPPL